MFRCLRSWTRRDSFRHTTSHGVLRPEIYGQFNQLARLFKAREEVVFFQLLVVVLNKVFDDAG